MRVDKVVVNASPLIVLFKSGLGEFLPRLFDTVAVPDAVWAEIAVTGEGDLAAKALPNLLWVDRVSVASIPPEVAAWNLGDGESEVLSFARANPEYRAMIDDHLARNCARTLGIKVLGTGGALVEAKRQGLISSVSAELERVRSAGLWLSDEVVALLIRSAGERT